MLNFALLGCGKIAKRHSKLLGKGCIDGARLSAVCDINAQTAKAMGDEFNVPSYTDMHEMMNSESLDAVSVLTPSGCHANDVEALAPYGKAIIVEKPMALTLDDADRMIQACDHHGAKFFVVKQNRFNKPVTMLRQAIEEKRFGKLVIGTVRIRWCRDQQYYDQHAWRGTWEHDGGVLANQASHHIDLLEWMMGDIESVFAESETSLVDIETEDTAAVVIRFRNGALGIIEATTATRPRDLEGSLSVLGEKGAVVIGGFAVNKLETWNFEDETASESEMIEEYRENPPHPYGYAHQAYYEHVVDCINNDRRQLVDGLEGRKSLELITAIYESIETGQKVPLRFKPRKCKLGLK